MTRRPAGPASASRWPAVLALLLLVLTELCLLGAPGARLRAASALPAIGPGAQPDPGSRVAVLVDTLEPAVPQPSDVLRVSGRVINRAAERFAGVQISLHLGSPVRSRQGLQQLRDDPVAEPLASRPQALGSGGLDGGAEEAFTLAVPARDLLTHGPGVYPLQVTVVGRTTEGLRDLGTADTFLPYVPSGASADASRAASSPLPIAWVLPVSDRPRLTGDGGVSDTGLTSSLTPGGALDDILAAATALPTSTLVVDPALLRAVALLAAGSSPAAGAPPTTGPAARARPADPAARAWLEQLTMAADSGGASVVPTAFADADLETLVHAGRTQLADQVLARGTAALREVLAVPSSPALAVPPAGRLDAAGAATFARAGATSVLVDADGVGREGTLPGRIDVPGARLSTVVPDPTLTRLLQAGPTAAPTPRLAEQTVLAELAEVALGAGAANGPVVLAPDSGWTPAGDWATRLATDTARYPWLRPIGLSELLHDADQAATARSTELRYPDSARAAELPADAVAPVTAVLSDVAGFAEALPRRQTVTRPVTDTALTALSAAYRGDPAGAATQVSSARSGLDTLKGSVRTVASREITLTSRNGRLPVTLENNLPETVDVTLRMTSLDRSRVRSDSVVSRTIQPGQKVQVEVEVRATSAGTFPVRLALLTPSGRPLGPPDQVLIRSTTTGVVAIGVTVAALAVLVLAVLGRGARVLLRRRRRALPEDGSGRRRGLGGGSGTDQPSPSGRVST